MCPPSGGRQPAGPVLTVRCEMSLKLRSSQRPSPRTTSREIEPLSEWTKAKGRLAVACRQSWPITAPWTTATAVVSAADGGDDLARSRPRRRAPKSSQDSPFGIASQRSSAKTCGDHRVAAAGADPVLAALEVAEVDLAQLRDHDRLQPGRLGQRRRRFLRAPQAGDEEAAEFVAAEALGDHLRLRLARPPRGPGRSGRRRAGTCCRRPPPRRRRGGPARPRSSRAAARRGSARSCRGRPSVSVSQRSRRSALRRV